ncbi:MAG: HD domain-containing protein [Lachnospiraceae bacterium]|nr:HD domain-containing protein [Lachnospiraceae bacterium]
MNNTQNTAKIKKYTGLILVYIGFILINILFNRVCGLLGVPLYLDCIGTLLAAALGGFFPGIIVGYVTNLINASGSPETAFYSFISVLIAVAGAYFAYKGYFKKVWKTLLTIPVFAWIGGGLGSLLTYLLYGFGMGEGISAPFAAALLENGTLNVFWAQLISDFTLDLIDKAITVLLVYALLRLVPKKISESLELTSWQQKPLDSNEHKEIHATAVPHMALRTKMIMIIGMVMVFVALTTCTISYVLYNQFAVEQMEAVNAGMVMGMDEVTLNGVRFITKIAALFVGFFIVVLAFCLWYMRYHLTYPINAMTYAARSFAYNSGKAIEEDVKRFEALQISTGDEIETLYDAVKKTMADTVTYFEDIHTKDMQIEKMQNGLIYILADLVESRDKCTGDHVKKTAAYVKLILELLRESPKYKDIVTDEYIDDVCNSAPLHDVGKIKVSDLILNKPARLSDEEFTEMKKHTVAGKNIIEGAMELTGGSSGYLREALNLATYHHEKWDGTGYPEGLKGEEIPLSARIMAVSDVFDALLSERSYKKPFTHEEAMNILKEGSGKNFDPEIVRLFFENESRVKQVEEANKRLVS